MRSTYLHICDFCGTYWELAEHALRAVDEVAAQRGYHDYFRSQSAKRRTLAADVSVDEHNDDDDERKAG